MKTVKLKSTQDIEDIKKDAMDLIQKSEYGKFILICDIEDRTVVQMGNLSLDAAIAQLSYAKHLCVHEALVGMHK